MMQEALLLNATGYCELELHVSHTAWSYQMAITQQQVIEQSIPFRKRMLQDVNRIRKAGLYRVEVYPNVKTEIGQI